MKLNSISGFTCYVEDLATTAEFYEAIGFRAGKREPDRSEPRMGHGRNREFVLRDPDGYKLVFFEKK